MIEWVRQGKIVSEEHFLSHGESEKRVEQMETGRERESMKKRERVNGMMMRIVREEDDGSRFVAIKQTTSICL